MSVLGLALALGSGLAAQEPPATEEPAETSFQIVVHAENPATEMPAARIARMFLNKLKRWEHGVPAMPIDLETKSPVRQAFTRAVHGKSVTAIESYWQRMIFSGRGVPPDQMASEEDVLDFIRHNPGGIGYVGAGAALGDGVKKLGIRP